MTADVSSPQGRQVTQREAIAAARVRVTADRRLKRTTPAWIVDLANKGRTAGQR